jgi:hypothetical protein
MGFEELEGAISENEVGNPITPSEVKTADESWDDDTALGIVLQDTATTIEYLQSKGLVPLAIENADDLIRGFVPPRKWADGKSKSSMAIHTAMIAIEKILSQCFMAIFAAGKKDPFIVEPVGQTLPAAARANASLLRWIIKQNKAVEEFRHSMKTGISYGFTVMRWGWESRQQRKKVYKKQPDGSMKGTLQVTDIELPICESCNMKQVLVDPTNLRQNCQNGRFVIYQMMTDGYGLDDLRQTGLYKDIPSDEELFEFLARKEEPTTDSFAGQKRAVWREFQAKLNTEVNSKDPFATPLEIIEYVTKDRVVTVLQRKLVIRNEANEFGRMNYQSVAYVDVLGSHWGFGVPRLISGEQRLQTGIVNNWNDSLVLTLNPVLQLLKGIGAGTQNIPIAPGKIIQESGELKPLVFPDISSAAMEGISASELRANDKAGSGGGQNMPSQALRTKAGVDAFASDVITRLQYWMEMWIANVYIPTLEAFLEMAHEHFTPQQINAILTVEEGKDFEGDISDVYNAQYDVQVTAGADMLAKYAAAQLMPMIIQLVGMGPVADQFNTQGKKFNYVEFITDGLDRMGWTVEDIIQDQTEDDKKRVQEQNQAMQRAQAMAQQQQQKHQDDLEDIDATGSMRAGVDIVKQTIKNHLQKAQTDYDNMQNPTGEGQDNG